ncbi:MAG: glycosyl transferase group 1 [Bacteroidetes bacterium]|nr:glycosyl transferase group 1 [Bacteroidota bacterium]MDF2452465.1 glycosyl transferase group 1 [Bacteroidota bacterium]
MGSVDVLGPYEPGIRVFVSRILNQIYLKLFNKRISYRHSKLVSKGYAHYFNNKLKDKKYDFIIAPAASCEIAFLETNVPIIYITDGTFAGCLGYHKSLSNLTKKSIEEGNEIEQRAITNSKTVIVSSEWAKKSVINDYHKDSRSIRVIPYGANFESIPAAREINFDVPKIWKLFFVGVYWETKGGDIAFNAFKILIDKGYPVELTILGCIPPAGIKHDKMKVIPFIDKNSKDGQEQMKAIYKDQHFLILPTRFDCTPIVINEASAFGIPGLIADSGGVAGHLKNNENGFLIPYEDQGDAYAKKLETLINDPVSYIKLRKQTRQLYEDQLNWQHWAAEFKKIIS